VWRKLKFNFKLNYGAIKREIGNFGRGRLAEVAIFGEKIKLIRKRESYQDLIKNMVK
jgi:hypothetical protein